MYSDNIHLFSEEWFGPPKYTPLSSLEIKIQFHNLKKKYNFAWYTIVRHMRI